MAEVVRSVHHDGESASEPAMSRKNVGIPSGLPRWPHGGAGTQPALFIKMHPFTSQRLSQMESQKDRHPLNVRALLESMGTPFAVADYEPRAVVFSQGDACDSVM